jgi:hypothetical protein
MIPLEKQVVSLEPSRRLQELGVKQESLFYWWVLREHSEVIYDDPDRGLPTDGELFSAFTVAELDDLLPIGTRVVKNFDDYTVHEPSTVERKRWGNRSDENGADARAKMLIYLVENEFVAF